MPTQNKENQEMTLRDIIDNINKRFGSKISYKALYKKVSKILAKQGQAREDALTAAYIELSKEMCKNILPKAIMAASNVGFEKEYMNTAAEKFSIVLPSRESKILIDTMGDMISPGFRDNNIINENQLVAIRDYELDTIKSHTYYRDIDTCLKKWDSDCYNQDIEDFDNIFKDDYTYAEKKHEITTIEAAKYYYKLKLTRERLARHGAIWRFLNSDKVAMYKNYIEKTEQNLARIGFNEAEHGENAISYLKDTLIDPFSIDVDVVKSTAKTMISDYRAKHTPPLDVARKKIEKAKMLDANPNTSIDKKISPILKKYGLEKIDFNYSEETLNSAAESYDKTRFLDEYRDIAASAFEKSLNAFYNQTRNTWVDISVSTMVKDARAVAVAVLEHYSPMLETKAFSELEKPMYTKLDAERIAYRFESYARRSKAPLSEEKFGTIKKEVNDLISVWKADPKKLIEEDLKLAAEYAQSSVIREQMAIDINDDIVNDKNAKQSFNSIDLSPIIEESEETEVEKDSPSFSK